MSASSATTLIETVPRWYRSLRPRSRSAALLVAPPTGSASPLAMLQAIAPRARSGERADVRLRRRSHSSPYTPALLPSSPKPTRPLHGARDLRRQRRDPNERVADMGRVDRQRRRGRLPRVRQRRRRHDRPQTGATITVSPVAPPTRSRSTHPTLPAIARRRRGRRLDGCLRRHAAADRAGERRATVAHRRRASRSAGRPRPTTSASPATASTAVAVRWERRDDDRDLLRPHLQHELHARRRRLRRGRQPLGEDDRDGRDDRLPGHDAAVRSDRARRLERDPDRA